MIRVDIWDTSPMTEPPDISVSDESARYEDKFYPPYLKNIDGLVYEVSTRYGGITKPTYGTLSIMNVAFTEAGTVWPPPEIMYVRIYYYELLMFYGQIAIDSLNYLYTTYTIEADAPNTLVDATVTDTVYNLFNSFANTWGWTFDATEAPDAANLHVVSYETGNTLLAEFLTDVASENGLWFSIDAYQSIIKLADMAHERTPKPLGFKFFPVSYPFDDITAFVRKGEYTKYHGRAWWGEQIELIDMGAGLIEDTSAVEKIYSILDSTQVSIPIPLDALRTLDLHFGDTVTWTDDRVSPSINCSLKIRSVTYNLTGRTAMLAGETVIS